MTVIDTIRKAMFIGLGAADMATERIQQMIDDFVQRGDLSADQGKVLYQDIMGRMEERGRVHGDQLRQQVRDILKDAGILDRGQTGTLETRMDNVERKLDELLRRISGPEEESSAQQDR
jgi:polyhydroxyalkanoate synthesis regulator phasin